MRQQRLPIRTVLFGQGRLAIQITQFLEQSPEFSLIGVVPSTPENPIYESLTSYCLSNGLKITDLEAIEAEASRKFDLGVSVYASNIFSSSTLGNFNRFINLHNSLLPKYRGCRPINWALENGETKCGVTCHEIDAGIDTGPILGQVSFDLFPNDDVLTVFRRCRNHGFHLLTDVLLNLETILPAPQNSLNATYYSKQDSTKLRKFSSLQSTSLSAARGIL